ncbi:MAG: ZIP family metal transporter [bacterium]|nr:ZIP family metal transporter [bacterium]
MPVALYILGSVAVVSLVSLTGIFAISLRHERLMKGLAFLIPLAVGALLGDAFFHLIPEAFVEAKNPATASFLLLLGVVSFFFLEKFLRWHHHSERLLPNPAAPHNEQKHLGPLILISDGIHNFIDGVIIGVSYLAGIEIGIATTLAVLLHEIPQEIGDFGVLLFAGYGKTKALFYNFLSALTALAGAILVLLVGSLPESLLQGVVPFAAGVFIYIASSDLVPELHKNGRGKSVFPEIAGIGIGVLAMYLLLFLE